MRSSKAYREGCVDALMKLGMGPLPSMLLQAAAGAAVGGYAGHHLSPEDRRGYGGFGGAGAGALGAVTGAKLIHMLPGANPPGITEGQRALLSRVGGVTGGAGGIGFTQHLINKNHPDSSEDPYRYSGI